MRAFTCGRCGQLLFFENSLCLRCKSGQGFLPSALDIVPVGIDGFAAREVCANAVLARCNWIVEDDNSEGLCVSCRLTATRPADADDDGLERFAVAEGAKRRLIFQLLDLRLPIESDLSFDLLSSEQRPVTTGHADGIITLDLAESDDVHREQRRTQLGEPYRTLLGHFRHEIGHYYWPIIVERAGRLDRCRDLFGDERTDYQEALDRHYEEGAPPGWNQRYVSAYATMHPWEDWAETFAHYLHIRDTLETATAFGIAVTGPRETHDPSLGAEPAPEVLDGTFDVMILNWLPLTYALNAVNRSMGRDDLYPFTLAAPVIEKLSFVHACVQNRGGTS
ncbi:MAG TPA: putative zinc-binding metallopeptidase [Solirubrobacteraceae bacterium]|jgi:hypothetical protein|nr:putative zinc-binding metallopeptidase [Solirubrobacteraceae bacterium]